MACDPTALLMEQFGHLRLGQPYRAIFSVQAYLGCAVLGVVNDNLIHTITSLLIYVIR